MYWGLKVEKEMGRNDNRRALRTLDKKTYHKDLVGTSKDGISFLPFYGPAYIFLVLSRNTHLVRESHSDSGSQSMTA
jgi:hypothetical protein